MGGWGCLCEEVVEEGSFPATPAQLVRLGGRLGAMAAETEVKFKRVRIHSSIPKVQGQIRVAAQWQESAPEVCMPKRQPC